MLSLWGKELRRLKFIIASSYLQKKHDQNDLHKEVTLKRLMGKFKAGFYFCGMNFFD